METTGMPDTFDRTLGNLKDLPDVLHTKPTTMTTTVPIVGHQQTYIVRTFRQSGSGDTIFVETMGREGAFRFVLPPEIADAISRQRESLTVMARRKHGHRIAALRKASGQAPGFMSNPGKGGRKRKRARKAGKKR